MVGRFCQIFQNNSGSVEMIGGSLLCHFLGGNFSVFYFSFFAVFLNHFFSFFYFNFSF